MDDIIQLLQDFKEYTEKGYPADFSQFGDWLKQKYHSNDIDNATIQKERDEQATHLLSGISNFVETWVKLSFQDLPVISIGDFDIIKAVEFYGNPSKKMVAEKVVMERSTCIESIKRLLKEDLLTEDIDSNDRRVRRVKLTNKGKELSGTLDKKMTALGALLLSGLEEEEKAIFLGALKKVFSFQDNLYHRQNRQNIKDIYEL